MCAATESDMSDEPKKVVKEAKKHRRAAEFGLCVDDYTSFLCYTQKKQINAALTY